MPISPHLLNVLCCPITRHQLKLLTPEMVSRLNEAIERDEVLQAGGSAVKEPIDNALISLDGEWIYRIVDEIPVMLADQAIAVSESLRAAMEL